MNTVVRRLLPLFPAFLLAWSAWAQQYVPQHRVAQPAPSATGRTVMEVFIRSDSEISKEAAQYARDLGDRTRGLEVVVHDVLEDRKQLSRLWELTRRSGRDKPVAPAFYCCDRLYFGFANGRETGPAIEDLFTAHVYTRSTCPRCQSAKTFINNTLKPRWPAIRFRIYEITYDAAARQRYEELCRSR